MERLSGRLVAGAALAALALVLMSGGGAIAQAIVSTGSSFLRSDLAVGARAADGSRQAGLVLEIEPGWKTYWRSPGEAGVPPQFDWSGSRNLADLRIAWPRPSLFESFGLTTLGYGGRVILPMTLIPENPSQPIALDLSATLGVCRDICVLEEIHLSETLAPGAGAPDAALIAVAEAAVPPSAEETGVALRACRVAGAGEDRQFSATISLPENAAEPFIVLEGPEDTWFHGQTVARSGDAVSVEAVLSFLDPAAWMNRSDIRITVLAEDFAADIRGCRATNG